MSDVDHEGYVFKGYSLVMLPDPPRYEDPWPHTTAAMKFPCLLHHETDLPSDS